MSNQVDKIKQYLTPISDGLSSDSKIYLFGSSTRKDLDQCNDIDIVITHGGKNEDLSLILNEIEFPFSIRINNDKYINVPTTPPSIFPERPNIPSPRPITPPTPPSKPKDESIPVHVVLINRDKFEESEVFRRNSTDLIRLN